MQPPVRLLRLALLVLGASAALSVACYEVPSLHDYYACKADADCGDGGFVCDDGVCCREREDPLCVGRVLDGGTCLDGGQPLRLFEDLDEDGFGNLARPLYRCARPEALAVSTNGEDCNDNPSAGGRLFFPGAPEQCDGFDNDCDGTIDEGLDGGLYYRDEDNDGFGNPSLSGTFCQRPAGWVDNPDDCAPENGAAHPGALEVCNGVDDDCNRLTDDTAEVGQPCAVPGARGVCAQGARACVGSGHICRQTVFPAALDTCNSLDDDCDGLTDEKPDCGGPAHFAADPSVVFGAQHLNTTLNGVPGGCVKGAYGTATPQDTVSGDVWRGSGTGSHVFWAEREGGTWDLSRPMTNLKLFVDITTDGGTSTNPWSAHKQPVVLLCGPGGFLRLVSASPILDTAGLEQVRQLIPLPPPADGSGTWVIGGNSTPDTQAVLRQVRRVEVLIQPGAAVGFTADFHPDFGLP